MLKVIKEAIKGPIIDWNNYLKDYEIIALKTNLAIPEITIQHLIDDDRLEISDNKTFEDLVDELKSWLENHKSLTEGIHLLAIVKDNGEIMTIERDTYNSKQAFKKDLKDNGYTVTKILDNRDLKVRETGRFSSFKELEKELKYYTNTFGKDNSLTKELQDLYDEVANIPLTESKKLMEKSLDKVTQYYFDLKDHIKKTIDANKDRENIHLNNQYWKDEDTLNLWKKLKNKIQQNIRLRDTDLKLGVISKEKYEEDNKIDNIMLEYVNNRIKSYKEISKKESVGTSFSNILLERGRNDLLRKSRKESPGRWERREYYKNFRVVNTDITDLDDEDTVVVEFEVGDYKVYVAFSNILLNLREIVKQDPKHMVKFDWVIRACNRAIDQADIYVRCNCLDPNTKIKLLNGDIVTIKEMKELHDKGKELWVYSTDEKGDFKPGKVEDVWVSGTTDKLIEIELDNGEIIRTTDNHQYMMRDGRYIKANELKIGDSLMPLYFINDPEYAKGYEQVKLNSTGKYHSTYKIVTDNYFKEEDFEEAKLRSGEQEIITHHKDFNKHNNYPTNFKLMGKVEHLKYHGELIKELWNRKDFREKQSERARKRMIKLNANPTQKMIDARNSDFNKRKLREYWKIPGNQEKLNQINSKAQKELWKNYTEEERENRLKNHNMHKQENRDKLSKSNKRVWASYTEEEYRRRCQINSESNQKGKEKIRERLLDHWKNISKEEKELHIKNVLISGTRSRVEDKLKGYNFSKEEFLEKLNLITNLRLRNRDIKIERGLKNTNRVFDRIEKVLEEMILNKELLNDSSYYKSKEILKNKLNKNFPDFKNYYNSFDDLISDYKLINYNHKIKNIRIINLEEPIEVYDLSVEKYHNFYVNAGVILHNCGDFKYRFGYVSSKNKYIYGKKELRPADIRNPNDDKGRMLQTFIKCTFK